MCKKVLLLLVGFCLLGSADAFAQEKLAFGVRPNTITPQAAYFGVALSQQLILAAGLQILLVGTEDSYYEDWNETRRKSEFDLGLYVPSVGVKYYLRPARSDVVPYLFGSLFSVIPTADGNKGAEEVADDSWSFGFSAAFGTEYFFGPQFSIGGEFGMNFFFAKYDGGNDEAAFDIEATYAALSLNFFL